MWISFESHLSPTDKFVLPQPLRVFENDECVVELLVTSTTDLEGSTYESNYHASLQWYGCDGRQGKLDVRRLIRKQLRKVSLILYRFRVLPRQRLIYSVWAWFGRRL